MTRLALLVCPIAAALSTARAQVPDSTRADSAPVAARPASRPLCFGLSFDRGCGVMLQYEAGIRVRPAGGLAVGRGMWERSSSSTDFFVGGGVMVPVAPGRAVGVIYQAGSEGPVHSLGVRYARSLGGAARFDLTAGGTFLRTDVYGPNGQPRRATSPRGRGSSSVRGSSAGRRSLAARSARC